MLDTPTISVLQSALDYASVRQDALADNVANINTPGYQRRDASFDQVLAAANPRSPGTALSGLRDDPGQIPFGADAQAGKVEIETPAGGPMRLDGNNVDMDLEMGRLAKNQIYFQGLSQLMAGQFATLKYVIGGGK